MPIPGSRSVRQRMAANGQRSAVAFWGGVVQILDDAGRVQAMRKLPQDVTALMWSGGQLIIGDADGRLTALNVK